MMLVSTNLEIHAVFFFFLEVFFISVTHHIAHRDSLLADSRKTLWVVASENLYMVAVGVMQPIGSTWCARCRRGSVDIWKLVTTLAAAKLPRRGRRSACGARMWPACGPPATLPSRLPPRCRCLHSARAALSAPPLADAPPPAVSLPSAVALPLTASWLLRGCFLAVSWLFSPAAAPAVARSPAAPPSDGFGLDQQAETSTWCWCVRLAPPSGLPGRRGTRRPTVAPLALVGAAERRLGTRARSPASCCCCPWLACAAAAVPGHS